MTKVHSFYVENLLGHLADAVKVANDPNGGMFPVGTVIQLVPQEAMVKRRAGFGPELNDWEFFTLTPSAQGTVITARGGAEVLNRFAHQSCAICHVKANIKFDFICEKTHGCDPLGIPDSVFIALQQSDPGLAPPPADERNHLETSAHLDARDDFGCGSASQHGNRPIGAEMGKLQQVADGVWVRQSDWVWTNSIVVRGADGLVLIDPGIHGSELNELADDVDLLGIPVVAGFCTHPHWDHLLWHPRFGDVPRYATSAAAQVAEQARERAQRWRRRAHPASRSTSSRWSPHCPRTGARCRARSSSIGRTRSATPRSSSRTAASCSPATSSPTS